MIFIGKPIEFNADEFVKQLEKLEEMAVSESCDIKSIIKEIVPTYQMKDEK